jgi:malate dehydrogenase (oxaloacetate-decarboxylating)(NADP+)
VHFEEGIGFPIIGNKEIILELKEELVLMPMLIIDPKINEEQARRNKFAKHLLVK